jgi:MFS family permease
VSNPPVRSSLFRENAFRLPAYQRLWTASVALAFASWLERLAVGWVVLEQTGSPFLSALTFAVRMAPNMVVGPITGVIADRMPRPQLMAATALIRAGFVSLMGAAILADLDPTAVILALVALAGIARTFEIPAEQALIVDIVGTERSTNAIGLHSVGVRAVGLLGAGAGGVITDLAGAPYAFLAGVLALIFAAIVIRGLHVEPRPAAAQVASLWREAIDGLRTLARIPVVAALLVFAIAVEILAFSYNSLLPSFADTVLGVGPSGLAALAVAAGAGSVAGSALLASLGRVHRHGVLILTVTLVFGLLLFALGLADRFAVALVVVAGVGAMAAMFDALQWILLQRHVPDEMRGRALGAWVWAIGFGWLGPVALGLIAEGAGVPAAFAISGSLVAFLAVASVILAPGLRRA